MSSRLRARRGRSSCGAGFSNAPLLTCASVCVRLRLCSVKMVLLWTAGDVFKTSYFVMNQSPAQFWVCGATQILIDVAILLQVLLYSQDTRPKLG